MRTLIARFQRNCTAQKPGKDGEPLPGEALYAVFVGCQPHPSVLFIEVGSKHKRCVLPKHFSWVTQGRGRILSIKCNYVAVKILVLSLCSYSEHQNGHRVP